MVNVNGPHVYSGYSSTIMVPQSALQWPHVHPFMHQSGLLRCKAPSILIGSNWGPLCHTETGRLTNGRKRHSYLQPYSYWKTRSTSWATVTQIFTLGTSCMTKIKNQHKQHKVTDLSLFCERWRLRWCAVFCGTEKLNAGKLWSTTE